jgi:FKBP-type peptidyl-prolyl cis-trans isomerase
MKITYLLFIGLFCLLSACSYSEEQISAFDNRIKTFTAGKSFRLVKSESGLYTEIIEPGKGREIHLTDSIGVSYVGRLLSGKKFDEQKKTIYLPMRGVIDGWKEALLGQKQGVKLRMIVPPQLGYGAGGMDKVPANAELYFELRVDDVK